MPKELCGYDYHSHKVIFNVGHDWSLRRNKRGRDINHSILNRPRAVVLFIVITVFLFLFLKEARTVLANNPQFAINDIVVENINVIKKEEIVNNILKPDDGKGLFSVSTKEIVKLLKRDPDIDNVVVERVLPGTLKIRICERIPYARLEMPDSGCIIDNKSVVLLRERQCEPVPVISGLPKIDITAGERCSGKKLEDAVGILREADNAGLGRFVEITRMDVSDDKNIFLSTRERIFIKIKVDNIRDKLDKLMLILTDAERKNQNIKLVDLRFKDAYVE